MCFNYIPFTRADRLPKFFGVTRERDESPPEVYPTELGVMSEVGRKLSGQGDQRMQLQTASIDVMTGCKARRSEGHSSETLGMFAGARERRQHLSQLRKPPRKVQRPTEMVPKL